MKRLIHAVSLVVLTTGFMPSQANAQLTLKKTIVLDGVKGKFDHFAIDQANHRLFAAATGNQSVEVIDLATGKSVESLTGLGKPHGLAWVASSGRLFVADGGKAELAVYEGTPLKRVKSIPLSEDADDMAYDPASKLLFVGHGGTNAANPAQVAVVDAEKLIILKQVAAAAHPEGVEQGPQSGYALVNISDTGQVLMIEGKSGAVTQTWQLRGEKGNTPLAYDSVDNLVLVGCRTPAKLVVLNAKTGVETDSASSHPGVDDLFYDPATHRAYLIAGSGSIDSFEISAAGKIKPFGSNSTLNGAKTGLLVSSQHALYIGIPGTTSPAAIQVYETDAQ